MTMTYPYGDEYSDNTGHLPAMPGQEPSWRVHVGRMSVDGSGPQPAAPSNRTGWGPLVRQRTLLMASISFETGSMAAISSLATFSQSSDGRRRCLDLRLSGCSPEFRFLSLHGYDDEQLSKPRRMLRFCGAPCNLRPSAGQVS
jgi:hypothetical protein